MEFLIQSKNSMYNYGKIPMHEFGYATIEAIDYKNWWDNKKVHSYIFMDKIDLSVICNHNKSDVIPVGSVEFCLEFYNKIEVKDIKPLNIPMELRKFCTHDIDLQIINRFADGGYPDLCGKFFVKSKNKIKDTINGMYIFPNEISKFKKGEEYFISSWIEDIISEWRLFIYNKEILGLKCYSGNEWVLPNRIYCERIVSIYDKKSYTLDVMVYKNKKIGLKNITNNPLETDIVELHDFFACGLYGFNHHKLLDMMMATHKEILNNRKEW